MKIIGGKDYYDGAGYGYDDSVKYIRKSHFLTETPLYHKFIGNYSRQVQLFFICVAGITYPVASTSVRRDQWSFKDEFFYTADEIIDHMGKEWISKRYFDVKDFSYIPYETVIKKFFNTDLEQNKKWLIENKIVIATSYSSDNNRCNEHFIEAEISNLSYYQFYKCLSPTEIHQQIQMYIDGVLTNNPELVILSDKSKIQKAGFDHKQSFRKRKQ